MAAWWFWYVLTNVWNLGSGRAGKCAWAVFLPPWSCCCLVSSSCNLGISFLKALTRGRPAPKGSFHVSWKQCSHCLNCELSYGVCPPPVCLSCCHRKRLMKWRQEGPGVKISLCCLQQQKLLVLCVSLGCLDCLDAWWRRRRRFVGVAVLKQSNVQQGSNAKSQNWFSCMYGWSAALLLIGLQLCNVPSSSGQNRVVVFSCTCWLPHNTSLPFHRCHPYCYSPCRSCADPPKHLTTASGALGLVMAAVMHLVWVTDRLHWGLCLTYSCDCFNGSAITGWWQQQSCPCPFLTQQITLRHYFLTDFTRAIIWKAGKALLDKFWSLEFRV